VRPLADLVRRRQSDPKLVEEVHVEHDVFSPESVSMVV
jgi:hypothetical protein